MQLNLSVKNKIFSLFIVVIVIAVSAVGWFGFKSAKESYIDSVLSINKGETKALSNEIKGVLGTIPEDVIYNANFYALEKLVVWEDLKDKKKIKHWKNVYISALKDYIHNKKLYYQIRILDIEGNEKILLKYDEQTNKIIQTEEGKLQNKSHRNYFKEALKLKKGEFYISVMNLNIEKGQIEKPYVPVVRYSTPLINENGEIKGVIVLNFNANYILNEIATAKAIDETRDVQKYYLLNEQGYYLFIGDKTRRWGFQLGTDYNFNRDYPGVTKQFKDRDETTFIEGEKIFSMHRIYPNKAENPYRFWYLVTAIDVDTALSSLDRFVNVFFIILVTVLLLGLLLINGYISKLMDPLAKVTFQLKALAKGEIKKEEIEYKENDEIGQIVSSTTILVDAIETTINQANAVSNGDFTKEIALLGKNDQLGLAIKDMTKRLKEITNLAVSLSVGNYDVKIIAKSSDDQLGLALIQMINYLETITKVAESISTGEIDVTYKTQGSEDRLGGAIMDMIAYLNTILNQANAITNEDFSHNIEAKSKSDELGTALVTMTDMLRANTTRSKEEIWFSEGIGNFSDKLTGIDDTVDLAKQAVSMLSRYVGASSGVIYTFDKKSGTLHLISSYAYTSRDELSNNFKIGEGVVGQVALEEEPILLKNIKDDEFEIQSGTTLSKSKEVFTFPLIHEGELFGVAELMSFESFTQLHKDYLVKAANIFATALHSTVQNMQIKELLDKSQRDYEESQLKSEELQQTNVQMEEQAQQLKMQAEDMNKQNLILTQAKADLDKQAEELMQASRYKSEFLANMSHELRTPLNSIVLLSKMLRDRLGDEEEGKKAEVIHNAGNDLLLLINDILDLSKIEAGQTELNIAEISSAKITSNLQDLFTPISHDKDIPFVVNDELDSSFDTDMTKVTQVLKNLLSNAFKFTKEGSVTLHMYERSEKLNFAVIDTGIGIPKDKLEHVFEAFKQVDGSISREYGGTGLGLSISLRFAKLLGGELTLESTEGEGSTFTLSIPKINKESTAVSATVSAPAESAVAQAPASPEAELVSPQVPGSAEAEPPQILTEKEDEAESAAINKYKFEGNTLLLVDDDSRNIFTLSALYQGVGAQTLHALSGHEALDILKEESTVIDLILMDIMMPKMDGYTTIEEIRRNKAYDHIPIIAVTAKAMKEDRQKCIDAGANDYITKPINEETLMQLSSLWIDKMK
ncbi:MAG: response regulator [Campylobacterota bacterium]|nr:response regulator [Campylobacterota bacterium]